MKIFVLLLTFITTQALAGSYYVYHQADLPFSAEEIYTEAEYKYLKTLNIDYRVSKIQSEKELSELVKSYPHLRFERVQNIELFNYTDRQWYIKNQGGSLTRWITDIDTEIIQATEGEDIQNLSDGSQQTQNIKVAIIDSGIDTKHPDLINNIIKKESECQALAEYKACLADRDQDRESCHERYATVDTDGNGYPLDCQGWSMTNTAYPGVKVTGNPEIIDTVGHGTHIAGIIGAEKNNIGIDGIADTITLVPIQVAMSSASEDPIDNIAKGLLYAIQNGAQVVNLSLGWKFQFDSKLMRDMVAAAIKRNIAIVVAAGNDSHSDISYPCAYQGVICVAAHDETGNLSSFSNRGTSVDIIAPGTNILSTWPTNLRSKLFTLDYNYEFMSGTSQAAPIVSALMAKLLSRGFSTREATLRLLAGARAKKQKSDIRFGNIDYQNALSLNKNSLVIPENKEPYLVVYKSEAENKFKLKIKNLGKTESGLKLHMTSLMPGVTVRTSEINLPNLNSNESMEVEIPIIISDYSESELRFNLNVNDQDYMIRANIIRIVSPEIQDHDFESIALKGKLDSGAVLKPFENISSLDQNLDFIAVASAGSTTKITLLKKQGDEYQLSRTLPLRDANPVFLNFSKIDIDKDGKIDYVVTYVTSDRDGNKTTKFLLFENDLRPKRYLVSPENKFDNVKTFIPGKYKWLSLGDRFVPAWIGFGENGTDIQSSPWEPTPNTTSNYLYYLDAKKGLQHITLPKQESPLHMLYQSVDEKSSGKIHFITFEGTGFLKEYKLYAIQDQIKFVSMIGGNQYFDIFEPRPLPLRPNSSSGFFNESSNGGGQNIFSLEVSNDAVQTEFFRLENPFKSENIKFVNTMGVEYIFYQTDFKIATYNRLTGTTSYRESKVNTRRRRYQKVAGKDKLYLPAREAPGFTSEVLTVNSSHSLISLGQYRVLAIQGCEDMGLASNGDESFITFACLEAEKILFLPIK